MEYEFISKSNYTGKIRCNNCKTTLEFYTKKQMKTIYPNKNYRVVGEVNNPMGVPFGLAKSSKGEVFSVYREDSHNVLTEKVVGYVAVDIHNYLAVIKSIVIPRLVFVFFSVIIMIVLIESKQAIIARIF